MRISVLEIRRYVVLYLPDDGSVIHRLSDEASKLPLGQKETEEKNLLRSVYLDDINHSCIQFDYGSFWGYLDISRSYIPAKKCIDNLIGKLEYINAHKKDAPLMAPLTSVASGCAHACPLKTVQLHCFCVSAYSFLSIW